MLETGLTRNKILTELTRSPHGKLIEYTQVGGAAAKQEPEFYAHLIAWNSNKGQVRDARVALPVVSLAVASYPRELGENSLAHLAKLNPRELLKAFRFALELRLPTWTRSMYRLVSAYLRELESEGHWQRVALQHRNSLRELYALTHTKPSDRADAILFKGQYPPGSLFDLVKRLRDMSASEAAGVILDRKIPFLIAQGALGAKAKEPDLVLALITNMSPTELVTNTKMLERLGLKTNPALRGAYEARLAVASKSKANVLKTTRAAEAIEDEGLKTKLRGLQDRQLESLAVEGNWLVLADKSGSMQQAIETARHIAAVLAKSAKGKVWLVFFDTMPQTVDVTGASLDIIKAATQYIRADGGTSIGCGLQRMLDAREEVDGIAIVSDACENQAPLFWDVYKKYSDMVGKDVPVYLYKLTGSDYPHHAETFLKGHDIQVFDLTHSVDYYSLPNLVTTMRTNRYSLIDEVMATKLLTLGDVLKTENAASILGKEVAKHGQSN
jgi:hypothetical protein